MSLPGGNVCRTVVEDCRDFLRTGRCKYGASCKYNHPPNVQNGGGIKQLDPSEPMFPVRPHEPVCQYYMKHGTCKFGQACKFHHPPQSTLQLGAGSSRRPPEPAAQLVLNPVGPDPSGHGMMLQFLPQRPEEADCIYFLKNGRCKYGATCRYHHPIRTTTRHRVRQDSFGRGNNKVQYVAQVLHKYPNVVSMDGSVVTMDGSNQGYVFSGSDGFPSSYGFPANSVGMTEQSSSASSVASSCYEASNQDMDARPKRNMSVGSLNSGMVFMPHSSSSDGSLSQQRRTRAASYGSISDTSPTHFDPSSSRNGSRWHHQQPRSHQQQQGESNARPAPNMHRRNNNTSRRRSSSNPGAPPDEGFTMMTSALLNMLDTTEEIVGESHSDEDYHNNNNGYQHNTSSPEAMFEHLSIRDTDGRQPLPNSVGGGGTFEPLTHQQHYQESYPAFPSNDPQPQQPAHWKPTWRPSQQPNAFSMLPSPAPGSAESDIGLYLP